MGKLEEVRGLKLFLNDKNLMDFKSNKVNGIYSALISGIDFSVRHPDLDFALGI